MPGADEKGKKTPGKKVLKKKVIATAAEKPGGDDEPTDSGGINKGRRKREKEGKRGEGTWRALGPARFVR